MSKKKCGRNETLGDVEIQLEECLCALTGLKRAEWVGTSISRAFMWAETPQGHDYWCNQCGRAYDGKRITKRARRIIINTILERYGEESVLHGSQWSEEVVSEAEGAEPLEINKIPEPSAKKKWSVWGLGEHVKLTLEGEDAPSVFTFSQEEIRALVKDINAAAQRM